MTPSLLDAAARLRLPRALHARATDDLPQPIRRCSSLAGRHGALLPSDPHPGRGGGIEVSGAQAPLLELRGVSKRFVKPLDTAARIANLLGGECARRGRARGRRRRPRGRAQGEVVGLVGESGCGKSTLGRIAVGLYAADRGQRFCARRRTSRRCAPEARRAHAAHDPDDLPGSVRFAQSAHARRRTSSARRRSCTAWWRTGLRSASTSRASLERVGLDASLMRRYPAPVLRRPAAAHRHRARARGEARVPRLRRGGRGARRVDPGAGPEPVHATCARNSSSPTSSSATTSGVVRAPLRPRGDHVPRTRGRDRADRGALRAAEPSLHAGAARRSAPDRRAPPALRGDRRRDPLAARAAPGMPFPSALPARDAAV